MTDLSLAFQTLSPQKYSIHRMDPRPESSTDLTEHLKEEDVEEE